MEYDAKKEWTKAFLSQESMAYPSEYVIRIFKGTYPRLNLDKKTFLGKKICDVGCGDGRNIPLLKQCGFETYGVEITDEIVKSVKNNLNRVGMDADVRTGVNDRLPFPDEYFDYLLSWNACYYMGNGRDFGKHVKEFARVLKKDGVLVLSIPKSTAFIYKGSELLAPGYQTIKNDPFGVRNGEILRMFSNESEIEKEFGAYFKDFVHGSIEDDCFGLEYHWFLTICKKK
jgi:SAM-dependent methyltransferase